MVAFKSYFLYLYVSLLSHKKNTQVLQTSRIEIDFYDIMRKENKYEAMFRDYWI